MWNGISHFNSVYSLRWSSKWTRKSLFFLNIWLHTLHWKCVAFRCKIWVFRWSDNLSATSKFWLQWKHLFISLWLRLWRISKYFFGNSFRQISQTCNIVYLSNLYFLLLNKSNHLFEAKRIIFNAPHSKTTLLKVALTVLITSIFCVAINYSDFQKKELFSD